jgi:hypothetical protein
MRALAICLSLVGGALRALAVKCYWGWFAVPIFQAKPLSLIDSYGLYSLGCLLTFAYIGKIDDSAEESVNRGIVSIIWPLLSIIFGAVLINFRG